MEQEAASFFMDPLTSTVLLIRRMAAGNAAISWIARAWLVKNLALAPYVLKSRPAREMAKKYALTR